MRIVQEHRNNILLTQQLEQSRRQSAIMHLTEGIAHNMNNLLGVMVGYVNLLQRNVEHPEKIIKNCERLEAALKRMTRIVHQLTVIGHFKSVQMEPTGLQKLLSKAVIRFQNTANSEVPVQIISEFLPSFSFSTNHELLEVCLERLLQNALDSYSRGDTDTNPEVGDIILEVKALHQNGKPAMQLSVLDRGKGIDKTIQDSIFDPFVSSSSVVGRGMGLTIARHSVDCLGGTISVSDREGGGTQSVVTLPLADQAVEDFHEN